MVSEFGRLEDQSFPVARGPYIAFSDRREGACRLLQHLLLDRLGAERHGAARAQFAHHVVAPAPDVHLDVHDFRHRFSVGLHGDDLQRNFVARADHLLFTALDTEVKVGRLAGEFGGARDRLLVDVGHLGGEHAPKRRQRGRRQRRAQVHRFPLRDFALTAQGERLSFPRFALVVRRREELEFPESLRRKKSLEVAQGPAHFGIGDFSAEEVFPAHLRDRSGCAGREFPGHQQIDLESIGLVGGDKK